MASLANKAASVVLNRVTPASIYGRPALSPLVIGPQGKVGANTANLMNSYQYTLQQMAQSPFAVNNEEYMRRIRAQYGYNDEGWYNAAGIIGGTVGAGVGALLGGGLYKVAFQSPLTETAEGGFKIGKHRYALQPIINRAETKWTGKLTSKRQNTSKAFRMSFSTQVQRTLANTKEIKEFNKAVDNVNTLRETLDDAGKAYLDAKKAGKSIKDIKNVSNETKKTVDTAISTLDNSKKIAKDAITNTSEQIAKHIKDVDKVADIQKTVSTMSDSIETGAKISTKSTGFVPWVGLGMDVVSTGMDTYGLISSIQANHDNTLQGILDVGLAATALSGDIVSVVGDILQFTPLIGIGEILDFVGSVVSIAAGALQGWLVGRTAGRSLSPSGLKSQELFNQNLYSSWINRPLTSVATLATMYYTSRLLGKLSQYSGPTRVITDDLGLPIDVKNNNVFQRILGEPSNFLTNNALGNYMRSGVVMLTSRMATSITRKVEDTWKAPDDVNDLSFISAYSVYGDINDNLYGATEKKATLMALATGDPNARIKALARSWGYGPEIYNNVSIAEARQAAGINLGNLGNSLFDTIGEIIIDPENITEVAQTYNTTKTVEAFNKFLNKQVAIDYARTIVDPDNVDINTIKFFYQTKTTDDGKVVIDRDADGKPIYTSLGKKFKDDPSTLNKYVYAYLVQGEEGVRDTLIKEDLKYKGTDISVYAQHVPVDIETVMKYLNTKLDYAIKENKMDIDKQKFIDFIAKRNLEKRENKDTDDAQKIKENKIYNDAIEEADDIFKKLYKYYGDKTDGASDATLIAKFIEDNNLKLHDTEFARLYTLNRDLATHMDMIDAAATAINTSANIPVYLFKKGAPLLYQKLLHWFPNTRTSKQSYKILTTKKYGSVLEEALKNHGYTKEQIKEAYDKSKSKYNQTIETNETVLNVKDAQDTLVETLKDSVDKMMGIIETQKQQIQDARDLKLSYTIKHANNNEELLTFKKVNSKYIISITDVNGNTREITWDEALKEINDLHDKVESYKATRVEQERYKMLCKFCADWYLTNIIKSETYQGLLDDLQALRYLQPDSPHLLHQYVADALLSYGSSV